MSSVEKFACPTCGAAKGERCRTLNTRRVTDTHSSRLDLEWDAYLDMRRNHGRGDQ